MCADGSSVCAKTSMMEERLLGKSIPIFSVPDVSLTAGSGEVFDFVRRVVFLRPAFPVFVLGAGAIGGGAVAGECAASVLILIASE